MNQRKNTFQLMGPVDFQTSVWCGIPGERTRKERASTSALCRLSYLWQYIWAESLWKNVYLLKYQRQAWAYERYGHSNPISEQLTLWPSENVISNTTGFMHPAEMQITLWMQTGHSSMGWCILLPGSSGRENHVAENKSLKRKKRKKKGTNIQDSFLIKGPTLIRPSKFFSFLLSFSTRELIMTVVVLYC